MRLVHSLAINLSQDEAQVQSQFKRDATVSRITIDTYTAHASGSFSIPDGDTESLSIGDVASPNGVYIEVANDCDVYLSGSLDPIELRKATGKTYAKLFLECNLTSVSIEASQGVAVTGTYLVWG